MLNKFLAWFRKEKPVANIPYVRKTPRTNISINAPLNRDGSCTKPTRTGLSAYADQEITAEVIARMGIATEESEIAMMAQEEQPHLSFESSHAKLHTKSNTVHHSCSDNSHSPSVSHSYHHDTIGHAGSDSHCYHDTTTYPDSTSN